MHLFVLMLIEKPKLASSDIGARKEMPLHIGSSSVEEFTSDSDPIDIGVEDVGRLIEYGSPPYSWKKLNLVVWQSLFATTNIYFLLTLYVFILYQTICAQLPNLI